RTAGVETAITGMVARRRGRPFVYMVASDRELDPARSGDGGRGVPRFFRRGLAMADLVVVQHEQQAQWLRERSDRASLILPAAYPFPAASFGDSSRPLWVGRCVP